MQIKFHTGNIEISGFAKTGEGVFGPEIARAAMADNTCHYRYSF
jgi:hypothetical protein